MARQTKANYEDLQHLSQQLKEFIDLLSLQLIQINDQWQNLRSTWHDDQCNEFGDRYLDGFLEDFKQTIEQYQDHSYFLSNKIRIVSDAASLKKLSQNLTNNLLNQEAAQNPTPFSTGTSNFDCASTIDQLSRAFLDTLFKALEIFVNSTAATMMFVSIFCGALIRSYDAILSPLIDIYDRSMIGTFSAEGSPFNQIYNMANEVNEKNGIRDDFEDLNSWQGVLDKKREEDREKLLAMPEQFGISGE